MEAMERRAPRLGDGADLRATRPRKWMPTLLVRLPESQRPPGYEETAQRKLVEAVRSICLAKVFAGDLTQISSNFLKKVALKISESDLKFGEIILFGK